MQISVRQIFECSSDGYPRIVNDGIQPPPRQRQYSYYALAQLSAIRNIELFDEDGVTHSCRRGNRFQLISA